LVGLVVGGPVAGSWWGHSKGSEIFHAAGQLEDHPDIATTKLVSGKVTYVHRRIWPDIIAVGQSREPWQLQRLTGEARTLLARVDAEMRLLASGNIAKQLEQKLLVASRSVHTDSGSHALELLRWEVFAREKKVPLPRGSAAGARAHLEALVGAMNKAFGARAKLPWLRRL
jgi:hypothetical protein